MLKFFGSPKTTCDGVTRRDLLHAGGLGLFGLGLSDFFRRAAANRAADILADERTITLTEDEAIRSLDALETVDAHAVARLADLRART